MRFKIVNAYFGSVTLYRVVKLSEGGSITDIHTYNDLDVAYTVTKILNKSLGV